MQEHTGIILRRYLPKKQKISLLDRELGRIESIRVDRVSLEQLHAGSVLCYYPVAHAQWYQLEGLEIIQVPLRVARDDIYFLHHVLELSYYFLPLHSQETNLFDLILFLVYSHEKIRTSLSKKIFLLRFFAYLGMYPEEDLVVPKMMRSVMQAPLEVALTLSEFSEKVLEQWLLTCVDMHPYKDQFKTHLVGCNNAL